MESNNLRQEVLRISSRAFHTLGGNSSKTRGSLATLRKSGLGELKNNPDVWEIVYRNDPFGAYNEREEERLSEALFAAMHLYAVHVRKNDAANKPSKDGGLNMGQALAVLKKDRANIDPKASAVFSSTNPQQITRLLSPLLRMVSAKVSIDYPQLVWELYLLTGKYQKSVLKNWAMAYYRNTVNAETVKTETKEK